MLSPRAYRRFAIPTKLSESMLEIYRDDDEQLCVELVDSSVIRVRKVVDVFLVRKFDC